MGKSFRIAVLPGDGIGPEVVGQAVRLLRRVEELFGLTFEMEEALFGGAAYDQTGRPLPDETLRLCREADAVLMGAVGGPKWDQLPRKCRPETGLLSLRKELELYANLRPAVVFDSLADASTLKADVVRGVDLLVVRELTGGIYFGDKSCEKTESGEKATDLLIYHDWEIERIVRKAFELARVRRKKVTSVDKANVLESSWLWRRVVDRLAAEYPDVETEHMLVDNCAMQLVARPKQFDVIVTENMFGDILSDEAAMLTGSIGMLPSASLGGGRFGLYEPVHGSAPDIAGKGVANPLATILSAAMMLKYSFGCVKEGELVEEAVRRTLDEGARTADLARGGEPVIGTEEMGRRVCAHLENLAK
ncbi:MAG: 3-isopropylmalate dehydrogenase [Bacillaceae bacterium G1]|nr:MAG: 3-isopropylmalate dehydrogenase [Bacillaceae bacterium G1]